MNAVTLQDVSAWTERESVFWHFVGIIHSATRNFVYWLVLPFALIGAVFLAQLYPFRIISVVQRAKNFLPCIQDDESLVLMRDVLRLAYTAGFFYRRLSLFQGPMQTALEELDEMIDSLNLVLDHNQELEDFAKASEAKRSPDLPLRFDRRIAL